MTFLARQLRGRIGRFHTYLMHGTDTQRRLDAIVRRVVRHREYAERRRLSSDCPEEARLSIPRNLGFRVFGPGELGPTMEVVQAAREAANGIDEDRWPDKQQLRTGLLDGAKLSLDSPFVRFALGRALLGVVRHYLGVLPVLGAVDVWCSRHTEGSPNNSQLFHCDWDDLSQVKIFVYCSDIDETNGPLVLVDAVRSKMARAALRYSYGGPRYRATDAEMEALVPNSSRRVLTGPVGTVALVDTSRCFHYGSRLEPKSGLRIMAFFQYLTPASFAFRLSKPFPYGRLVTPDTATLDRLVLGGNAQS